MSKRKIIKFKNGSVLLYKRRRINKSVSLKLFFKVGAANTAYEPGILHFGEHLRCKRTKELDVLECDELATKFGMHTNGATSSSFLNFSAFNSIKKIEPTVKLVTEKMFNEQLDDNIYENEKKVICNEIDREKDDDARQFRLGSNRTILKNPYYFCDVVGEHSDILNYTQENVQKHVSQVINSNNLVAAVTGNISVWKVKRMLKKYVFNQLNTATPNIKPLDATLEFNEKSALTFNTNTNVTSQVFVAFPIMLQGKNNGQKESIIIHNYIMPLFNSRSGIIMKHLRHEFGLVYSGYAYMSRYKDRAYIAIDYKTNKASINKSVEVLAKNMRNLEISQEKLDELKLLDKLNNDKSMPRTFDRTIDSMYYQFNEFNKFIPDKEYENIFKKITVLEVNETIKKMFSQNKVFMHVFGNATPNDVYDINQIENLFFKNEQEFSNKTNN